VNPPLAPRLCAAILVIALGTLALEGPDRARAQTAAECLDPNEPTPEPYGPTDVSAVTGNGGLSVALNSDATITVLKWPSPSFYDQIKYRTVDRSQERFGALPNEGAFVGIAWREGRGEWKFEWLRDWRSSQRYADEDSDEVVTVFTKAGPGLTVTVRDLVADDADALLRAVTVRRGTSSEVTTVRVFTFANFNPVYSKTAQAPFQDWCTEERNDEGAEYRNNADALVHARSGVDESTGEPSGAALAMGFDNGSDGHQIGIDTYESPGPGTSAYDDAADAKLSGASSAMGQVDGALVDELDLRRAQKRSTTIVIAAAFSATEAVDVLKEVRRTSATSVRRAKERWWKSWLTGARLPADAPTPVVDLAKRALISIRLAIDERGLVVTSVTTQPPYALDWIRHGAYVNRALERAGHPEVVTEHNRTYSDLQAVTAGGATPSGNWAQNFYADGVVGGPIPYEIDATGLGIWTLWDHYVQVGGNRDTGSCPDDSNDAACLYLFEVYAAIQRAAQYLTDVCRDLSNNLQCPAHEEDGTTPSQSLVGAQAVWLGLDSAARAARVRGTAGALVNAGRWEQRRDEIATGIETQFLNADCNCYTTDYATGGTLLWPVGYLSYGSERSDSQAQANWDGIAPAIGGDAESGGQESRALLGNAYAWAERSGKLRDVKSGLEWVARVPTTNETAILGEAWMVFPVDEGVVTTMSAQPHVWSQAMFYLAALKAYGSKPYTFD
jgi:GH15 family glucan-1,4-alpha-glucosidase